MLTLGQLEHVVTNNEVAVTAYVGEVRALTVPDTINELPVTSIGEGAFHGCRLLTDLQLPNSILTIHNHAFYGCSNLQEIRIPEHALLIGDRQFDGCTRLRAITVSPLNPHYSSRDGVLFDKAQLILLRYPMGRLASWYRVPNGVKQVWRGAFEGCTNLTTLYTPWDLWIIGDQAFYGCTYLTNIVMMDGLKTIGNNAFSGCKSLPDFTLPSSVDKVGGDVFEGCVQLRAIMAEAANPQFSSVNGVLFSKSGSTLIECPAGKRGVVVIPAGVMY
jgi:hypothetical protein